MPARESLAVWLALIVTTAALGAERTWTSADGRTMQAEFVREVHGDVTFIKDGKLVTIAIDKLSPADQQVVRDLAAGRPVQEESPSDNPFQPVENPFQPVENPFQAVENPFRAAEGASDEQPPAKEDEARDSGVDDAATPPSDSSRTRSPAVKPKTAVARSWIDKRGQQTRAKFVRMHNGSVVLMRGSRPLTIPFYDLSESDQAYVRDMLASRGEEDQIPPPPPPPATGDGGIAMPGGGAPIASRPGPAARGGPSFGPRPGFAGGPGFSGGPAFSPPPPPTFSPPAGPTFPASSPDIGSASGSALERMEQQRQDMLSRMGEDRQRLAEERVESMQRAQEQRQQALEKVQDNLREQRERMRQTQIVAECLSCKGQLTKAQSDGTKCPHCGVTWDYEIDEFGRRKQINSSGSPVFGGGKPLDAAARERVARIIVVAAVVVGLMVMGAVVIFVAVIIAAANSRKPQRYL